MIPRVGHVKTRGRKLHHRAPSLKTRTANPQRLELEEHGRTSLFEATDQRGRIPGWQFHACSDLERLGNAIAYWRRVHDHPHRGHISFAYQVDDRRPRRTLFVVLTQPQPWTKP